MNIFIIITIILAIIFAIFIWNSNKNKKRTVVLGKEWAKASEKENQRIETKTYTKSPLPNFGYSRWTDEYSLINPIENELDTSIIKLCSEFENVNDEKRSEIRTSINQNEIYILLEFVKRANIFGIRRKEPMYIHNGFVTVAMIESERCDYRDVLVTLAFLNYGIQKLKLDDAELFKIAIQLSEANTGKLIESFFTKQSKSKELESIGGYVAIETNNGISFIQTYFQKYDPEKNLVKMLVDIAEYVSKDKYGKGEITIGNKITSYWLSADNDKNIEKIISKATGCASLSSQLKKELHIRSDVQMLQIYIAEFKEPEAPQILINQINNDISISFSRLGFIENNIFCLVIQRATMEGINNFETNASLKRLEAPLREIIKTNIQ